MFRPLTMLRELRRRHIFRGVGVYVVGAWVVLQVADVIAEPAGLPPWTMRALLYLAVTGFPAAVFLAWRYEFTEDGIVRTKPASESDVEHLDLSLRKIDYAIFAALLLIVGFLFWQVQSAFEAETEALEAAAQVAQAARENSIAVLPFADLSPDSDQKYLAEGLSDTVLHLLSQVTELSVTARTSSFAYQDKGLTISQIGDALGVANILEGSVQRAGDQLRIIARLVDAPTGEERWSASFNRTIGGIFEVQDEIAQAVVAAMKVNAIDESRTRLEERYRPNLQAYEQYVLGRSELLRGSSRAVDAAEQHFQKAIGIDPGYALAYVGLAEAHMAQVAPSGGDHRAAWEKAEPLLERAIELDPLESEAYSVLASIMIPKKEFGRALTLIRRAMELNPSAAFPHMGYSQFLMVTGRPEEALVEIRTAAALDPESPKIQASLAETLWSISRAEEAMGVLRDVIASRPELAPNYIKLARWLKQTGEAGRSIYYVNAVHRLEPDNVLWWQGMCEEYAQLWDREAAIACFEELVAAFPDNDEAKMSLATMRGDNATAATIAEAIVEADPKRWYTTNQLGEQLARLGEWERIVELYQDLYPDLYDDEPEVNDFSMWPARILAQAFIETGGQDQADRLLEAMLQPVVRSRKLQAGGWRSGIEDVQIYALQGRPEEALDALEEAVEAGWMYYSFSIWDDPSLDSLRDDPRFDELMERIRNNLAEERAWFEKHKDDPLPART